MSLRTIGYTPEGKPIRIDEGPAYAAEMRLSGSFVTGEPGSRSNTPADRRSSQRYRQAHKDRVNECQRRYRARLRAEAKDSEEAA